MKVLILTTHLNYGGISSYCVSLSNTLAQKGHTVFIASASGEMSVQLSHENISQVAIPIRTKSELSPRVFLSIFKLVRLIRQQKIDIIHAHTRVTQIVAYYLSKITKVPFTTTCHGFFKRNIGRQIQPAWGDKVIAISDAVKKHLMIDFYVNEKQIALIPNGIDISRFRVTQKRNDKNIPARTVGIVARLSPVKGHMYLIEAMARVIKEFPDGRLLVFGDGNIKYKLIKQAEELKIAEKVFFLPSVSNTAEVLQEIDIFAMPSLQEGLGLAILEAQACGIPVIGSNVGGIPTVIKHDLSGLLVQPKEPMSLAGAIMRLMESKELAIRLGMHARDEVVRNFNLETMVVKIEEMYKEILKK
ncbi:MAG: glycosyltransferase family 4 protein [Candidatus Omnitrophota bacterium]